MAIDEATRAFMSAVAAQGRKPFHKSTPEEARLGLAATHQMYGIGPEMTSVRDYMATRDNGLAGVPLRVLTPSDSPEAVIVYYHGGGWVLGDVEGVDVLGRKLAVATNSIVVLVEYCLAPEHPFPAPVVDACDALRWVSSSFAELDISLDLPLVVAGDSAGANLAIAAARTADTMNPVIAALLIYPVTDYDFARPSYVDPANQLLLSSDGMRWFFSHYVAPGEERHPDVSPLHADDLALLPPTALVIAQHDPLRDEGIEFGARLTAAGVPVRIREFEGQMHGFFTLVNVLPASDEAITWLAQVLKKMLTNQRMEMK